MREETKKVIINFLNSEFKISRVKDGTKWKRAVIIPSGYVREDMKIYDWKKNISIPLIISDLIQVISNVFGCSTNISKEIVLEFVKIYKI